MKALNHLSWGNFTSTVFLHGQQRVHRVTDSPFIELFGDGISNQVGLWLEVPRGTTVPAELSRLGSITSRLLRRNGRDLLEVAVALPSLHRQFYHFAVAVAERVVVEKTSAIVALTLELQSFIDLLEGVSLLSIERQLGLLGELIFLERLVTNLGVDTLDAWLGPLGETHDFRLQNREFEVKTTTSTHRIHTINGMEQLIPSEGCLLCLVSILLGPPGAGNGFSLSDKATELSTHFAASPARLSQFQTTLNTYGFRDEDRIHYMRLYAMRRPVALVPVDDSFPSINRLTIQKALGSLAPRVEALQYDVSVEGLEHEYGAETFDAIIRELKGKTDYGKTS